MERRIIKRGEWGAQHDNGFHDRALPAKLLGLHHSVTIAPDLLPPFDDDYAAVRTLENIGESRFGGGISYTWAVTPVGLVFEGHSPGRSGAHTLNLNDTAAAIVWVGDYSKNKPTEEQILATAWLVAYAWQQGWIDEPRIDGGHGQLPGQATGCPGQHALAAIPRINQLAADTVAGVINLEDQLLADERNALMSTHAAIYYKGGSQGDQSIIERLVECQLLERGNSRKLDELLGRELVDVDESELALALAPLLRGLPDEKLDELSELVSQKTNDERDRRERERLEVQP